MHFCKICDYYTSTNYLIKKHYTTQKHINNANSIDVFECNNCKKNFKYNTGLLRHQNECKPVNPKIENNKEATSLIDNENEHLKMEIIKLELMSNKNENEYLKMRNLNVDLDITILRMKGQIIELKAEIQAMKNQSMFDISNKFDTNKIIIENNKLYINDIEIMVRPKDLYISVSQICNIYNKNFNEWCKLDYIGDIVHNIAKLNNLSVNCIIDDSESDINQWVFNELFIQFCQYISPKLSLYVNKFIKVIISNSKEDLLSIIKNNEDKIESLKERNSYLESMFVKKCQRIQYPENVIYLITTEDIKEKGVYIIGKAKNLTNRLSTYNKTAEHEVVYYRKCKNYQEMNAIEKLIIKELEHYKERANRDRLILRDAEDIQIVKDTIKQTIESYNI